MIRRRRYRTKKLTLIRPALAGPSTAMAIIVRAEILRLDYS
jgi:hypothetical protein